MKIEDYLSKCELYRSVQFGVWHLLISLIFLTAAAWGAWHYLGVSPGWTVCFGLLLLATPFSFLVKAWAKKPDRVARLGCLKDSNYYLQFSKSSAGAAVFFFTILGLVVLLFALLKGPVLAARAAIIGLLIYVGFSLIFKAEVILEVSIAIAIGVGFYYLIVFFYHLIGAWIFCGISFIAGFLISLLLWIIPRTAGFFMALFSRASDAVAEYAYNPNYKEVLEKCQKSGENPYCCYGRVLDDQNDDGKWIILQYNYFYAFNDWRLAAIGANNHEGDWEAVSVFLLEGNPEPVGVAFSQHHEGVYRSWGQVRKVANPQEPYHPLVYVALGSHANYDKDDVSTLPEMWQPRQAHKFICWLDTFLRSFSRRTRQRTRDVLEKAADKRNMLKRLKDYQQREKESENALRDKLDAVLAGLSQWGRLQPLDDTGEAGSTLPCEFHTGDGYRIGASGDLLQEEIAFSGNMLPEERKSDVCLPRSHNWQIQLICRDSPPAWVEYQGLWGIKSLFSDESGPPGPKWNCVSMTKAFFKFVRKPDQRIRWESPLKWRDRLLNFKESLH